MKIAILCIVLLFTTGCEKEPPSPAVYRYEIVKVREASHQMEILRLDKKTGEVCVLVMPFKTDSLPFINCFGATPVD